MQASQSLGNCFIFLFKSLPAESLHCIPSSNTQHTLEPNSFRTTQKPIHGPYRIKPFMVQLCICGTSFPTSNPPSTCHQLPTHWFLDFLLLREEGGSEKQDRIFFFSLRVPISAWRDAWREDWLTIPCHWLLRNQHLSCLPNCQFFCHSVPLCWMVHATITGHCKLKTRTDSLSCFLQHSIAQAIFETPKLDSDYFEMNFKNAGRIQICS